MSWSRRRAFFALPVVVLALSIQAATPSVPQASPLTLVSTPWPPFTNAPGKPRFALDLVEAALGRADRAARTTIVPAPEFTTSLLSSRFAGSAAAWKDAEREKALIFSQPYLENRLLLVGQKGSNVSAKTLAALKGKRIAIVEGYSYGDAVDTSGPTFVRMSTEEDSMAELLTGAVDYTLMDELVVRYITSHYSKEALTRLQIGKQPIMTRPLYLAIRRDIPNAQAIIDGFNTQLRAMIADHTYHKLLHLAWINADVNGDGITEFVPASDRIGALPPTSAYALTTAELNNIQPKKSKGAQRFYVGGEVYSDWDSVPNRFKVDESLDPNPSPGSVFTINW
jgi:ABC-type amino acid transport substrate-binding protein